jgi:L-seryl-tRNA(Ser) seleniumtransferase
LEFFRDPNRARFNVPFLSLLDTPLENLRTRVERLAPQMAESAAASAEAVTLAATLHGPPSVCRLASWGIALTPRSGTSAALGERLSQAPYPVVGRLDADRLVLDLRTVFPRQDIDLVSAVTGE